VGGLGISGCRAEKCHGLEAGQSSRRTRNGRSAPTVRNSVAQAARPGSMDPTKEQSALKGRNSSHPERTRQDPRPDQPNLMFRDE
jgi:hypothetical protein